MFVNVPLRLAGGEPARAAAPFNDLARARAPGRLHFCVRAIAGANRLLGPRDRALRRRVVDGRREGVAASLAFPDMANPPLVHELRTLRYEKLFAALDTLDHRPGAGKSRGIGATEFHGVSSLQAPKAPYGYAALERGAVRTPYPMSRQL